jgi:hypothetical protein
MQAQTQTEDKLANAKGQGHAHLDEIVTLIEAMQAGNASAEDELLNIPLSIEIRDGWRLPGATGDTEEYRILLSTGGPACCIFGNLDHNNEPETAKIMVQDWFQPWTELTDINDDGREALLTFVRLFCFEE